MKLSNKPRQSVRKLVTGRMDKQWQAAKRRLARIESKILARSPLGEGVINPRRSYQESFMIQQTAAEWIASKKSRCSPSDLRNAMMAARWLEDFAGGMALTKRLASDFCDSLHRKEGYSQNTCFLMGAKIKEFLKWLATSDRCQQDYSLGLQWPGMKPQVPRQPYTELEYEKLIKANEGYNVWWLVVLMWHTGMASVDACDLRWGQVDMDECFIVRKRSKTGTEQRIPIMRGSDLHEALIKRRKECEETNGEVKPEDPVSNEWFKNHNNTRFMLKQACIRAGVKYKSPHSLRATMVSRMNEFGLNPIMAMQITGHKSAKVFSGYANVKNETLRREMAKITTPKQHASKTTT